MVLPIVVAMVAVPIWDWAAMGRIGLLALDCDYQYWPLSKSRIASVLLLFVAACGIGIVGNQRVEQPADVGLAGWRGCGCVAWRS